MGILAVWRSHKWHTDWIYEHHPLCLQQTYRDVDGFMKPFRLLILLCAEQSQTRFNAYVAEGTVLSNYAVSCPAHAQYRETHTGHPCNRVPTSETACSRLLLHAYFRISVNLVTAYRRYLPQKLFSYRSLQHEKWIGAGTLQKKIRRLSERIVRTKEIYFAMSVWCLTVWFVIRVYWRCFWGCGNAAFIHLWCNPVEILGLVRQRISTSSLKSKTTPQSL